MPDQFRYPIDAEDAIEVWRRLESPSTELRELAHQFLFMLADDPEGLGVIATSPVMGIQRYSTIDPLSNIQFVWTVLKSPPYGENARQIIIHRIRTARFS